MNGEWRWRGDTLEYFIDDIAVFKVDRIPHSGQPYCARLVGAKLSEVELKQLEEEGLGHYAKRSV